MLRDRLACGVTDGHLQHCLLAEPVKRCSENSNFSRHSRKRGTAIAAAQLPQSSTLHKVGQTNKQLHGPPAKETMCYQCSGNNHGPLECCFKDAVPLLQKEMTFSSSLLQEYFLKAKLEEQINSSGLDPLIKRKRKRM